MVATRQKIVQFLKTYPSASIREIGRALGLTDPDILYHIQALLENDEIELLARYDKAPARRGRPVKRYRLKHAERPDNYAFLAGTLFSLYLNGNPDAGSKKSALIDLAHALLPEGPEEKSLHARLSHLVRQLTDLNYEARWEARRQGPQVIFANCPYASVALACREMCQVDAYLLENYLQTPVQILRTFFDEDGSLPSCRFQVKPS